MQHTSSQSSGNSKKTSTVSGRVSGAGNTSEHIDQSSTMNTFELYYQSHLKEFERQAEMQSKEDELNHCVAIVSQMFDFLKDKIIIPALQRERNWHDDHGHQLKRNIGITGNTFLDDNAQRIAIEKGLTKEQWKRLLYLNFTADDSVEMINVSRDHLKKVHDMALRLLENEEQETVFALIDAITKHMPEGHLTDR